MTEKYKETDKMSDIICDDYRLLQVISRFGLTFGFGDQTVATACASNGVDTMTFLAVVNFIKSNGRINVGDVVETISVAAMTKYLSQSHTYFIDFRIPAIRRKLIESIDCSARNQIAFLILKFYDEFAAEVSRHMEYEDMNVFTYVNQLLEGKTDENYNISIFARRHNQIEMKLVEFKNIILKYYPEKGNNNLLNAVLFDIFSCEEDLASHCMVEDFLFVPVVRQLEKEKGI